MVQVRILSVAASIGLLATSANAFESTEHKKIGDRASVEAFRDLSKLLKAAGKTFAGVKSDGSAVSLWAGPGSTPGGTNGGWFTFGDLVAVYGDYMRDVDDLMGWSPGRYSVLKSIVSTDDATGPAKAPEAAHAGELVIVNKTHFSTVAVQTYVKWHTKALELAANPATVWQALHYEALALHSLTDLFAVGHMTVDRQVSVAIIEEGMHEMATKSSQGSPPPAKHTRAWWDLAGKAYDAVASAATSVKDFVEGKVEQGEGFLKTVFGKVIAAFENVLHNGYNYWGAQLQNLHDNSWWQGYGDHRYASSTDHQTHIDNAVKASITTVLQVANGKKLTKASDKFAALQYLPIRVKGAYTTQLPAIGAMTELFKAAKEASVTPSAFSLLKAAVSKYIAAAPLTSFIVQAIKTQLTAKGGVMAAGLPAKDLPKSTNSYPGNGGPTTVAPLDYLGLVKQTLGQ
jgi:hypothetical protein